MCSWWAGPHTPDPRLPSAVRNGPIDEPRPQVDPRTKPARRVAAGELEGLEQGAVLGPPALHRLGEDALHGGQRVQHQPPSDEARGVGEAVGVAFVGGGEQQPGGADAVGGDEHHVGALVVLGAVAVDPVGAGGEAVSPDRDAAHPCPGDELRPEGERVGPVGDVGGALRPLVAALAAAAAPHADVLVAVLGRGDGVGRRPPVPPEAVVGPRRPPGRPSRGAAGGRGGSAPVRIAGVAAQAGDAELAVGLLVEREQLLVAEGPVVGHAVDRAHPEVVGEHAGPLRRCRGPCRRRRR